MKFRVEPLLIACSAAAGQRGDDVQAQTLTGQIGGTVVDGPKGVMPGATVRTNKHTATARP